MSILVLFIVTFYRQTSEHDAVKLDFNALVFKIRCDMFSVIFLQLGHHRSNCHLEVEATTAASTGT